MKRTIVSDKRYVSLKAWFKHNKKGYHWLTPLSRVFLCPLCGKQLIRERKQNKITRLETHLRWQCTKTTFYWLVRRLPFKQGKAREDYHALLPWQRRRIWNKKAHSNIIYETTKMGIPLRNIRQLAKNLLTNKEFYAIYMQYQPIYSGGPCERCECKSDGERTAVHGDSQGHLESLLGG